MPRSRIWGLGAAVLMVMSTSAQAADLPPEGSKALSAVVQSVEKRDLGVITEVNFDDGYWEVELQKEGREIELHLDPRTSEIVRETKSANPYETLPPRGSKPLSEIIQAVEKRDLGVITEVDFDDGYWEFEIRDGAKKIKLDVDPRTGEDRVR